jgi:hypothetical protein
MRDQLASDFEAAGPQDAFPQIRQQPMARLLVSIEMRGRYIQSLWQCSLHGQIVQLSGSMTQ